MFGAFKRPVNLELRRLMGHICDYRIHSDKYELGLSQRQQVSNLSSTQRSLHTGRDVRLGYKGADELCGFKKTARRELLFRKVHLGRNITRILYHPLLIHGESVLEFE